MRLDFRLRDLPGTVDVSLEPNRDPKALGARLEAKGFPVCTATISYAGRGYNAALGWVQLVRSTDGASGCERFELDPYDPLGRLPHPFCWFGFVPTLFDAPARMLGEEIDWTAHSFLCFIARQEIRALLGFSWGFAIRDQTISLEQPAIIPAAGWDEHLPYLRREHPSWRFAAGYHDC